MNKLYTIANDKYIKLAEVFIYTLLENNKSFNSDINIMTDELSEENKSLLNRLYAKINYINIDTTKYQFNNSHTEELQKAYYKLEVFDQGENILFIDIDVIFLKGIRTLLYYTPEKDIAACACHDFRNDKLLDMVNSGVMIIKKPMYKQLYELYKTASYHPVRDQYLINVIYKNNIDYLPKKYNCEKKMYNTEKYKKEYKDAVIIHYVADKPDDNYTDEYQGVYKIWRKKYDVIHETK